MPRKTAKKTMPDVSEGMKKAEAMQAKARQRMAEQSAACVSSIIEDMRAEAEATKGKRTPTPADVDDRIPLNAWPVLFSMTKETTKHAVKDVIEGRAGRETLTEGQRLYFSLVENYIIAKAGLFSMTEGGDYPQFAEACRPAAEAMAQIFGIEPEAMRRYCIDLQEKIEEDNAQYLPTMQPTAENRTEQAAASLDILYMLKPEPQKTYLTPHSKFDLFTSYLQNTGEKKSQLPIWQGNEALVQWNINGGRITPFDQEIEAAVSNLVIRERARRNGHTARESVKKGEAVGFTVEQIFMEMNGITEMGHRKLNEGITKAIRASIAKMDNSIIDVAAKNHNGQEIRVKGRILHVDEVLVKHPGKKPILGYSILSVGKLTAAELDFNDLLNVSPEQRNIGTSGISITEVSIIIRKWLIREIFRIREDTNLGEQFRTIYFERMYDYEAPEVLVEYGEDGNPIVKIIAKNGRKIPTHIFKTGKTPNEKAVIRDAKKHRRDIALAILEHFRRTGLIKAYKLNADKSGVVITVDKTQRAARQIESNDKRQRRAARLTAKEKP